MYPTRDYSTDAVSDMHQQVTSADDKPIVIVTVFEWHTQYKLKPNKYKITRIYRDRTKIKKITKRQNLIIIN